jgi:hypothetical protein
MKRLLRILALLLPLLAAMPPPAYAQQEVTSNVYRYKNYEQSTGYYERYEVRPRENRPYVESRQMRRGILRYGPGAASDIRFPSRAADSHRGVAFYGAKTCRSCHVKESKNNMHVTRFGIQCRQCHGGEPIAGVEHYYSPMNRIRRHAYVCAKCHQGATYSYATYVTHAPNPAMASTMAEFPALFWAFWIMIGVAVLTFGLFLPHTLLWGLRELFAGKSGGGES